MKQHRNSKLFFLTLLCICQSFCQTFESQFSSCHNHPYCIISISQITVCNCDLFATFPSRTEARQNEDNCGKRVRTEGAEKLPVITCDDQFSPVIILSQSPVTSCSDCAHQAKQPAPFSPMETVGRKLASETTQFVSGKATGSPFHSFCPNPFPELRQNSDTSSLKLSSRKKPRYLHSNAHCCRH